MGKKLVKVLAEFKGQKGKCGLWTIEIMVPNNGIEIRGFGVPGPALTVPITGPSHQSSKSSSQTSVLVCMTVTT